MMSRGARQREAQSSPSSGKKLKMLFYVDSTAPQNAKSRFRGDLAADRSSRGRFAASE
jgi:hypothetical protein